MAADSMDVIEVGSGPLCVVALHGIQGTRAAWLPVAQRLSALCTFVLPNLQGRGAAPRPATAGGYTLERYAAAVREVVERHAGGRRFVLAGWSMGVSVALQYADRYRDGRGEGTLAARAVVAVGVACPVPNALVSRRRRCGTAG